MNSFFVPAAHADTWNVLTPSERGVLHRILNYWEKWIPERKQEGTAPLLTFEELYRGLDPGEKAFLDRVRAINPKNEFGFQGSQFDTAAPAGNLVRIENQGFVSTPQARSEDPQYLPENVYRIYLAMMDDMKKTIGKRLWVESGYRSPAYQLYTFLYFLPKHKYSLVETGHWVALPGYSEHGAPESQAIDFINEQGINGEDDVTEFERLPEYRWLLTNAHRFGFELSYPRSRKGITFEPWHWRYTGGKEGGVAS